MTEIEERVQRGAALLDEKRPGWAPEIAGWRLDLGACDECILGQLYGNYFIARDRLAMGYRAAVEHGFTTEGKCNEWAELKAAWLAEIARRIEAAPDGQGEGRDG